VKDKGEWFDAAPLFLFSLGFHFDLYGNECSFVLMYMEMSLRAQEGL